ncbi:MAG: BatD family protein, partial [Armatimonadetes bacterium]|nr:BatD family protein [Armatimonadota bacterium]
MSLPALARAQVQISAQVDQSTISQDETVALTVTVAGDGLTMLVEPTMPRLDGLQVVGTSTQQSISLVGGSMQTTMNYVYDLKPTRTGALRIPPVILSIRGHNYSTDPITITVTRGSGRMGQPLIPPSPGGNPFEGLLTGKSADVKHTVDHKTVYVGQQITYTFSFLQSEQLFGEVQYSPADTPGFVAEDLPNPPQATQNVGGRMYSVQRRMKALFATSPGKHTIGEASVTATMDPMLGPEQLVAEPITVEVLPLPQAAQPKGFSGAVGSFTVRLRVDRPVVRAGETVNCVVDVVGTGNIRSLGEPQLGLPDWVRVYKAGEKRTVQPGGGGGDSTAIGGTASFSYLLLPRQAGTLRVGPVSYSYFDPSARAYRTATSPSAEVTVAPGSGAAAPVVPADNLRPLKTELGRATLPPLVTRRWLWAVLALPLLVVLWSGWQRWQAARVLAAPEQARAGNALALAHKRFDLAARALAD